MKDHVSTVTPRHIWLALFAAMAVVLAAETAVRVVSPLVSGNVAASLTLEQRSLEAAKDPHNRIVLVGNSMTERGIDPATLAEARPDLSGATSLPAVLSMDSSDLWYWSCMVRALPDAFPRPKFLVIGYGWNDLSDQASLETGKTFGLVCPVRMIAEIAEHAGAGLEEHLQALTAKGSWTYALHADLRHRLLGPVIPRYESQTNRLNEARRSTQNQGVGSRPVFTYRALDRILADAQSKGYNPVIVAMPVKGRYEIDPALGQTVAASGGIFLDLRNAPGLDAGSFDDPIHLSKSGSRILTAELAHRLPGILPNLRPESKTPN